MCFEYLDDLFPEGRALLKILQMKVFTLGIISIVFHSCARTCLVSSLIGAGAGRPFSCRTCKQILYAALVVHLPLGVSFQHKMSSLSVERMGVLRILLAVL
jgi:hypothetical protein